MNSTTLTSKQSSLSAGLAVAIITLLCFGWGVSVLAAMTPEALTDYLVAVGAPEQYADMRMDDQ